MDLDEKDIITIDADEEDNESLLASLTLSDEILEKIGKKKYDIIRIKTDLFTKEYDNKKNLLAIIPFFIDVRIENPSKYLKVVTEYFIPTGAKITIYQDLRGVGFIYSIKIPETNITFQEIMDIQEEVDKFKETGETENEYIKRWFLSYGILDHLLQDPKVLEVNINPPGYKTAMRIVHADFNECVSNVFPSDDFLNLIATRLKINTGRPLNKAQPQLDGEIEVENVRARVAAIVEPFSVFGMGYSIRKHREDPWTLPLFLKNKMVDPWFAGLMSFVITHGRTFLTAGPRGSGKTSLLGGLLLEILPKYRILTIEDTQELPIYSYKQLGYDLLPLKVRSALLNEGMEMPFDTGLRTSLRLGDSCLIIGEIRSKEAKVLYESMRVGAMANVVAGTIHGDSPYGVFDRVVNDLDVPKGSFKVTDLIIIVNQIKNPTGLQRFRRVLKVTEVLKDWTDEPKFQDLLVYNPEKDMLEPTEFLLKGKSVVLKDILSRTRGYKDYNDVLKDIQLRAWAKMTHVKLADDIQVEAPYVSKINIVFANLYDKHNPTSSKKAEEEFKKEFIENLKEIFKADIEKRKQEEEYEKAKEEIEKKKKEVEEKFSKYSNDQNINENSLYKNKSSSKRSKKKSRIGRLIEMIKDLAYR